MIICEAPSIRTVLCAHQLRCLQCYSYRGCPPSSSTRRRMLFSVPCASFSCHCSSTLCLDMLVCDIGLSSDCFFWLGSSFLLNLCVPDEEALSSPNVLVPDDAVSSRRLPKLCLWSQRQNTSARICYLEHVMVTTWSRSRRQAI